MSANVLEHALGQDFARLQRELQDLHRHGGTLDGDITLRFGAGLSGRIGPAMARRTGCRRRPGRIGCAW